MQYRPHRYQTEFPVHLSSATGPQQVELLDVNTDGARISGFRHLTRGEKLQLDVLSMRVDAIVCWVSNDAAGITFRPKITDLQVDTLRHRPDGRGGLLHGSVGFAYAEMR